MRWNKFSEFIALSFVLPQKMTRQCGMAFQLAMVFTLFVTTAMAVNPKLPFQFQTQWRMVATINNNISIPLDWNPLPPKGVQYLVGSGSTYYYWERKAMLEIYDDFCVPIFGPLDDKTNLFKCNFLNVNLTSYLISEPPSPFPSCCVFGSQVFHPPAPDFLKHMNFNSTGELFDKQVDWCWIPTLMIQLNLLDTVFTRTPIQKQKSEILLLFGLELSMVSQYNILESLKLRRQTNQLGIYQRFASMLRHVDICKDFNVLFVTQQNSCLQFV